MVWKYWVLNFEYFAFPCLNSSCLRPQLFEVGICLVWVCEPVQDKFMSTKGLFSIVKINFKPKHLSKRR